MDGLIGVLVREHVVAENKVEQGHAAYKDNVMSNLLKLHLAILADVVSLIIKIILSESMLKLLGLTGAHGQFAV